MSVPDSFPTSQLTRQTCFCMSGLANPFLLTIKAQNHPIWAASNATLCGAGTHADRRIPRGSR